MTIGIATYGRSAGLAALEALQAVEKVGFGALHGYVSLVAIGLDGQVHRAETQRGGTSGLGGATGLPKAILTARMAGLISSGPDRPEPLAQFTPALPGVGLVTGHRFPSMRGPSGQQLNDMVLSRMAGGQTAKDAVDGVVHDHPWADAGLIALAVDGDVYGADTEYVCSMPQRGSLVLRSDDGTAAAAVLHNAILPWRALAPLAAEVALGRLAPPPGPDGVLVVEAGLPVRSGATNAWEIDDDGEVVGVVLTRAQPGAGRLSFGLGPFAPVMFGTELRGRALQEPFLVAHQGRLETIDGSISAAIPVSWST
ncbi:MAG: hypothetical protein U1E62_16080 [Alsobacter sp.]